MYKRESGGWLKHYDFLLLDIEMPLLDGMSAAQKIREQDATVVMIFITRMANK